MQAVTTIGLDIAKSVFQVHGIDAAGNVPIASSVLFAAAITASKDPIWASAEYQRSGAFFLCALGYTRAEGTKIGVRRLVCEAFGKGDRLKGSAPNGPTFNSTTPPRSYRRR